MSKDNAEQQRRVAAFIEVRGLKGMPMAPMPDAAELLKQFLTQDIPKPSATPKPNG